MDTNTKCHVPDVIPIFCEGSITVIVVAVPVGLSLNSDSTSHCTLFTAFDILHWERWEMHAEFLSENLKGKTTRQT